jgi:hypothetical protein
VVTAVEELGHDVFDMKAAMKMCDEDFEDRI